MKLSHLASVLAFLCLPLTTATAKSLQVNGPDPHGFSGQSVVVEGGVAPRSEKQRSRAVRHSSIVSGHSHRAEADPRPRAWCGFFLRHHLGVSDRAYNLARRWASWGSPARGPAPGVVAVWPHHVGIVTAVPKPGVIVLLSGNDGHAVRERERSTRGIIAYRWPPGSRWAGI